MWMIKKVALMRYTYQFSIHHYGWRPSASTTVGGAAFGGPPTVVESMIVDGKLIRILNQRHILKYPNLRPWLCTRISVNIFKFQLKVDLFFCDVQFSSSCSSRRSKPRAYDTVDVFGSIQILIGVVERCGELKVVTVVLCLYGDSQTDLLYCIALLILFPN